jgi:TrmH family RNA methyltransferase
VTQRLPPAPVWPASISSRRHALVQRCRRLAAGRTAEGSALLLDGPHVLAVALAAGWPLEFVACTDSATGQSPELAALVARVAAVRIPVIAVTTAVMDAMSPVSTPTGVVAVASPPSHRAADLVVPSPALVIATVDVQDPGNVGAILRSADAFGATGVACLGASADPFGWKALRGSMGSALRVPVIRDRDALASVRGLRALGLAIVVAGARGGIDAETNDWMGPTLLVVGSEGQGLPAEIAADGDRTVCLAMRNGVESLNVAVAVGVLLHEARRQRLRGAAR